MTIFSSILKFENTDNLVSATLNLINHLEVKVTRGAIREDLLSNPNYPSLLAVSESLLKWKIDSEAYHIQNDKLSLIPLPFIAHLTNDGGSFVTVTKVTDATVSYLKDNGSPVEVQKEYFVNLWSNNVLIVESSSESGLKNYNAEHRRELYQTLRLPTLILLLIFTGLISYAAVLRDFAGKDLFLYTSFWLGSFAGILITALLLFYEYDKNNAYLKKICSINKKTDCNAVLTSKGAKIMGLSWSEIGFFYFMGSFLFLILSDHSALAMRPLIVLSVLSVPYVIYSLGYQAIIIKQWCVFCLFIQFVIVIEFLGVLATNHLSNTIFDGWQHISYKLLLFSYGLPFTLWTLLKPIVHGQKISEQTKYGFKRFKNNSEVFNSILQKQLSISNDPYGLGIMFGESNAEYRLIKVCNPYCGPCAASFPEIEQLLKINREKWSVQILFTATADEHDERAWPIAYFLKYQDKYSQEDLFEIVSQWYGADVKDYQAFIEKFPLEVNFDEQRQKIALMAEWCIQEDITQTPTYYVNGFLLPESYNLEDLQNI